MHLQPRRVALAAALPLLLLSVSCGDDASTTPPPTPVLTSLSVTVAPLTLAMGQSAKATVAALDQSGSAIATGAVTWSSSSTSIATVTDSGAVKAVAAGSADITATAGAVSSKVTVTVASLPGIKINEVESNGGSPGDWAELLNPTTATIDISGWVFRDNDDTHTYVIPAGTTVAPGGYFLLEEAAFGFGLGAPDATRLFNPFGVVVDSYNWTAHAATTYSRCPNATGAFVTGTTSTKGAANDCSLAVRINEVESSGGTPGDWVELYNFGATTVDLSGYGFKDNDDTHNYVLPAGSTIAPGGYLVLDEASFTFGLGQPDAARLFTPAGAVVDSYQWDTHAAITYGRCPDGSGAFANTAVSTKGAANNCGAASGPVSAVWPGSDDVTAVDGTSVFGGNMSGLVYEGASGSAPAVLWAVRNGIGTLFRLVWNGAIWTPDAANGWGSGKALHYGDGTGDPDSEGVTYGAAGSASGMYVATERNNSVNGTSRNSILRFDPTSTATSLNATNEWTITSDLPVTGANTGIEAIAWIPDSYLTSKSFFDEAAGHTYVPAEYPNHGTGLLFVGLEFDGKIYAYALDHTANTFRRLATISTPFTGVMDIAFDRELNQLWAVCDDGCGGKHAILNVDVGASSATRGKFVVTSLFDRPSSMPNLNNEGFSFAPQAECANGRKPVFWSDDSETGGHAIRRASIPCTVFP